MDLFLSGILGLVVGLSLGFGFGWDANNRHWLKNLSKEADVYWKEVYSKIAK